MAAVGRALEPHLRSAEVERYAAPEAIRLAEIELRVGIAGGGERAPDGDGGRIIGALPGFDSGFHRLRGCRRGNDCDQNGSN
jgi:hypothetical protein